MADEQENSKEKPSDEEIKRKRARANKAARDFYLRNRHWKLEERREKRAEARAAAGIKRKPKKPKLPKTPPTPEELEEAQKLRLKSLEKGWNTNKKKAEEWRELGWIVAKMNLLMGLSQDRIYEILGGLATMDQIKRWCARGRKGASLRRPK